jgi:hypothetical protein
MNVLSSTVGGYASSVDQTGDIIELGANGSPFSIMPPHISMHWIIRAKKGYQATILSGHNHDNFYIRYNIPHTIEGGAARTLTDADRAQFRENAKVLRNDDDDTFDGNLTVTENLNVNQDIVVAGNAGISGNLSVTGAANVRGPGFILGRLTCGGGLVVTGGASISGGLSVTGNASIVGNLSVTESVEIGQKAYSALTLETDPANTLVTKSYVQGAGTRFKKPNGQWFTPITVWNNTTWGETTGIPWTKFSFNDYTAIPQNATGVILQVIMSINGRPDGAGNRGWYFRPVAPTSALGSDYDPNAPELLLSYLASNGVGGDPYFHADSNQAIIPINTDSSNDRHFWHRTVVAGRGAVTFIHECKIVGYVV